MNTIDKAKEIESWIIDIRRDLHMYPEQSFEEIRTARVVFQKLKDMGMEVTTIGKTGVLGVLKGKHEGKVLAFRADMDALSVTEDTGLSFSSKNSGVMHACGHDAHTAMLLGAAKILSGMREEFEGTIKFIFQPGEECGTGAKKMVDGGVLENPKVDMVFGMHILSLLEKGKAFVTEGPVMASGDIWRLIVKGKSCHGSSPWDGHDAIICSVAILNGLQTIVSRVNDARNPIVINVGTINGGERYNVIAGKVELAGMNRAFTKYSREMMPIWMEKIIKSTCEAYNCEYELDYEFNCDVTANDKETAKFVRESIKKVVGDENLVSIQKRMGSEDFFEYANRVPGAFIILGGGNKEKGYNYPHHNNHFILEENSLVYGTACFVQVAIDYLY